MKRSTVLSAALALVWLSAATAPATAGGTYRFHVSCEHSDSAVEWRTGDLDPGREYLKVVTGTHNPNCSITDYDPVADANLQIEVFEHEGAIVEGIPFIGSILCKIFC